MDSRRKFLLVLIAATCVVGCGRPAQIGSDEQTFNTVDALYTAVCAKRTDLVDQCERDLGSLRSSDKIPTPAHDALTQIIAQTRTGEWQPAAERLSKFMQGQRRSP